jgi:diacylglycerol kinase family enzyme
MDVLLFSGASRWRFFRLFREIQLGRGAHISSGLARIVRGRTIEIRSRESYPVEIQVDGDCVLETPAVCRASKEEVGILVPRVAVPLKSL